MVLSFLGLILIGRFLMAAADAHLVPGFSWTFLIPEVLFGLASGWLGFRAYKTPEIHFSGVDVEHFCDELRAYLRAQGSGYRERRGGVHVAGMAGLLTVAVTPSQVVLSIKNALDSEALKAIRQHMTKVCKPHPELGSYPDWRVTLVIGLTLTVISFESLLRSLL